jgi:hypothetical protein
MLEIIIIVFTVYIYAIYLYRKGETDKAKKLLITFTIILIVLLGTCASLIFI